MDFSTKKLLHEVRISVVKEQASANKVEATSLAPEMSSQSGGRTAYENTFEGIDITSKQVVLHKIHISPEQE